MKKVLIAILSTGLVWGISCHVMAADKPADKPAAKKEAAAKTRPFNGTIKSIDKAAKTITLEGEKAQTFQITSETKIKKDNKPSTFENLAVGDHVGGRAKESAPDKWEATTINAGAKPAKTDKPKK